MTDKQTDVPGQTDEVPADIAQLSYEQARDELAGIVQQLESGVASLEDSMKLWERGEHLATHCERWLGKAEDRINAMTGDSDDGE